MSKESRARWWPWLVLPLVSACAAAPPRAAALPSAAAAPIQRTLLQHRDLPELPGWETRLYLIEYAAGVAAPRHHHPVQGLGYVLRGSFESAFDGEAPTVVHEGESFTDPANVPHVLFRNADRERPLTFVLAYTVRKDAPVVETP